LIGTEGVVIHANLANNLDEAIVFKSSSLQAPATWVTKPIATIAQRHTEDAAVSSTNSTDFGFVVYGIPEFDRLEIKFSWNYTMDGTPVYAVDVHPSPWLGGIDGVTTKGTDIVVRAYVAKMCEKPDEKDCVELIKS